MPARRATIILDESCVALREALAALAPVFVFRRMRGFLATPADAAAEELHAALAAGRVVPPYVIVAASFGGFTALSYAARVPATLAGLVLVDPSHSAQSAAVAAAIPADEPATPAVEQFKKYLQGFGPVWTGSGEAVARITGLGAVPMIVLAAGSPDMPAGFRAETRQALTRTWHDLQRRHAALSTRGELRIVPGVGHNIVAAAPEVVVTAVAELVTSPND